MRFSRKLSHIQVYIYINVYTCIYMYSKYNMQQTANICISLNSPFLVCTIALNTLLFESVVSAAMFKYGHHCAVLVSQHHLESSL